MAPALSRTIWGVLLCSTLSVDPRIISARSVFTVCPKSHIKFRLFFANILSGLLWGNSTWRVTTLITQELHVFVKTSLWHVMLVRYNFERRTWWIIISECVSQKWQWINRTLRKGDNPIPDYPMQWNSLPQGVDKQIAWAIRNECKVQNNEALFKRQNGVDGWIWG